MKHQLRRAFLIAGTALLTLVGASGLAAAQEAIFVMPTNEVGATTYNPVKTTLTNRATELIYDTLVVQDVDLTFHPHLADSWEEAPDGMQWIFHLHKGVTFHNGEPFNAAAIAAWIPSFAGTDNAYMVAAIDKVEVVDDHTVKFVMKHPEPNLLFNFSQVFMGVPAPKAYKELGDNFGITQAIGTGPFKLESFAIGQETVLTRNDDYKWGSELSDNKGPAKIAKITFREIPEDSTAFLELKSGGVDFLYSVPTDYLPQLKAEPNVGVITRPGTDVAYMPINVTSEPFTDIKVREATAFAINQKEILASIYGGIGLEAHNFLISALPESKVDPKFEISYNPDRSAKVFDEAGWKLGANGIREKDGKPLKVKLWTQSDTEFKRLTEAVQAQLKAVGMDAEITVFDSSAIRDQYKKNEHQLAVRSYNWSNADILDWFFSGQRLGYPNISMWNDPKGEELNKKALTGSKTSAERVANFKAYHEYVLSQFPFVPIYQPMLNVAYNKDRLKVTDKMLSKGVTTSSVLDLELVQ
ncbi:ABC transporter substrate-binding protein [Taklimakanibacter deserti]|uniref:ABC transporter substrate-binding protein n=1 Tax=Taklimakanibacter deserti TaxID=2267839 RepID=UPI000E654A9F